MSKNYFNITLALAGVSQSSRLVQQLAHKRQCDEHSLRISLQSLIDLSPPSVCAVYGNNPAHLRMGLETLYGILHTSSRKHLAKELTYYTLGLIVLERKLNTNKCAKIELRKRINNLYAQKNSFDLLSDAAVKIMADAYVDIISPLGPRIQVTGAACVLQDLRIQNKVRAILLAGIRSAVLWRQAGGGKLQLMFARNRLIKEVKQILEYT